MPDETQPRPRRLRFGGFELRLDDRSLWANGQRVPLGARPIGVLEMLVNNRHRAVSKDELLEQVWDRIVEENNLQVQIATLRRILGAQAIVTVPGRGYRFAEDVEPDAADDAPSAAAVAPGNLSVAATPILGRERELRELADLIESCSLVTVSGAAGIGKTRLAQAVAHDMQGRFPDGIWVVELAALTDPGLLPSLMVQTTKVGALGAQPDEEELVAALRPRRSLVILDNAEHLVEPVGRVVAAVLQAPAAVRLLVTSQEPLRVASEHVFRLSPLAVPEHGSYADPAEFGAVQLFVDRARSADAAFRLNDRNVASIVEICRRLDGLPLAIELAAARVPLLGVEGVRTKLDERFRLLTAGHRLVPPRHKTLRAAMDWSCGLLSPSEAAVYRRLGLFMGTFGLEAAQDVAKDEKTDAWAVLEALSSLVDKSLVIHDGHDEPRYRMLESTREHAIDLLDRHGETDRALELHAWATRRAVERAISNRREDLVVAEFGNLRSAFAWAITDPGRAETAVALATLPSMVMAVDGAVMEATERILAVRPLVSDELPKRLRAQYWQWLGRLCLGGRMHITEGIESLARAEVLFAELGSVRHVHACLRHRAEILLESGSVEGAGAAIAKAKSMEDARTPTADRMRRLRVEGLLQGRIGSPAQALDTLATALSMARALASQRYELQLLEDLARLRFVVDGPRAAAADFRALAERASLSHNTGLTYGKSLAGLVAALTMEGDVSGAVTAMREALGPLCRAGAFLAHADIFALLAVACGDPELAWQLITASRRYRAASGSPLEVLEQTCGERALAQIEARGAKPTNPEDDSVTGIEAQDDLVSRLRGLRT